MRIGKDQLATLIMLATPTRVQITSGGRSEAGLVKRGLLREEKHGLCITPEGLRLLADEMEAGRVHDALDRMRKEAEARKSRTATQRATALS